MPAPCRDLLVTIDLSLKGQGKLPSLCRPSILPIPDAFTWRRVRKLAAQTCLQPSGDGQ